MTIELVLPWQSMMGNIKQLTDDELKMILRGILTIPLYRVQSYTGAESIDELPSVLRHHCPVCRQDLLWEWQSGGSPTAANANRPFHYSWKNVGLTQALYKCRNCDKSTVTIYLHWWEEKRKSVTDPIISHFQKVGQHPPIQERIDPDLETELKGEDLDYYSTAIRSRNFGMGLAACAYLRGVVEHRVNSLIDLIIELDKTTGEATNLEQLKSIKGARMSDRLDFANKILPQRLKPGGRNPLNGLYTVTSDGLHERTEQECIAIFDEARVGFEYLFKKLRSELNEADAYLKALDALLKSKKQQPER
jgi:hypothetical protein